MENIEIEINEICHQPEDNSMLYRYVTIDKLLDFIFNRRISLVKLNLFEDRLEGVTIKHLLLNLTSEEVSKRFEPFMGDLLKMVGLNIEPKKRNSLRRQREIFQNTNYASCWYINDHESVAMWQLYSKQDSVAIRIPYKVLSNEIKKRNFKLSTHNYNKLKFGCVDYYRFSVIEELDKIALNDCIQGFIKDFSFKHEQEFRIIIDTKPYVENVANRNDVILDEQIENLNEGQNMKLLHMTFDNFSDLPFEIIFHPKSPKWHRDNIIQLLEKLSNNFKTSPSALSNIFN